MDARASPQHRRPDRRPATSSAPVTSPPTTPRCSAPWPARRSRSSTGAAGGHCCRWWARTAPRWCVRRSPPTSCGAVWRPPGQASSASDWCCSSARWAISVRLGRRVSDPLRAVAQTAHRLREGDLASRAPVRGTEETVELAEALNGLAERTTELLANERAAVADLSHRLRTPVTALRLDAEAVTDPELAQRLAEHVATLQRSIDAILAEARRPVRSDLPQRSDAVAVLRDRTTFWAALAEEQGRPFAVELPGPRRRGDPGRCGPGGPGRRADRQRLRAHPRRHRTPRQRRGTPATRLHVEVADAGPGFAAAAVLRCGTPRRHDGPGPGHRAAYGARLRGQLPAPAPPSRAGPWSSWSSRSGPDRGGPAPVVVATAPPCSPCPPSPCSPPPPSCSRVAVRGRAPGAGVVAHGGHRRRGQGHGPHDVGDADAVDQGGAVRAGRPPDDCAVVVVPGGGCGARGWPRRWWLGASRPPRRLQPSGREACSNA